MMGSSKSVKTIGLLTHKYQDSLESLIYSIQIFHAKGVNFYLVQETDSQLLELKKFLQLQSVIVKMDRELQFLTVSAFKAKNPDVLLVFGGDGSMIRAARYLLHSNIGILGVNHGRFGFLSDLSPDNLEQGLSELLTQKWQPFKRNSLVADLTYEGHLKADFEAVNEICLHCPKGIVTFTVLIDRQFAYRIRADGFIVATPTGSTGHALSAGGPIIMPDNHALTLVPICPHNLSTRPIVVHGDSHITLAIEGSSEREIMLTFDGKSFEVSLNRRFVLNIRSLMKSVCFVRLNSHNIFEHYRLKFGWDNT